MGRISMQSQTQKKVEEAFQEFIKHCKVKNLSKHTIKYYEVCFENFSQFYSKNKTCKGITKETIQDYILHLRENTGANDVSINTWLRGLRAILYSFIKLGYLKEFSIELPKAEKKIKETYTDEELELLLKKPNIKLCNFPEYRDWVIVNYLLSTGNRANTIINLQISDIDFDTGFIKLSKTKNKKQQLIPLSGTLSKILQEYLLYRKGEPEDYLFCNIHSKQMTLNALESSIRKYNLKRGVAKTSIHLFRHTFAKKWILSGGDIFRLQKILGHSSLDIVREYVNMFSNDLQENFDKFNALEQLTTTNSSNAINMRGRK